MSTHANINNKDISSESLKNDHLNKKSRLDYENNSNIYYINFRSECI